MIAALYVDPKGPYFGRAGVDPWGVERDARLYAGPHPVVAHPPCERWGKFWWHGELGDDDGCFRSALAAVEAWGGVLEHPEGSLAWARFGLPKPVRGCWTPGLFNRGWSTVVDQGRYGHRARKRTWLFCAGDRAPPDVDWAEANATLTSPNSKSVGCELMGRLERRLTPPPPQFAKLLISIAMHMKVTS